FVLQTQHRVFGGSTVVGGQRIRNNSHEARCVAVALVDHYEIHTRPGLACRVRIPRHVVGVGDGTTSFPPHAGKFQGFVALDFKRLFGIGGIDPMLLVDHVRPRFGGHGQRVDVLVVDRTRIELPHRDDAKTVHFAGVVDVALPGYAAEPAHAGKV